MARVISRWLALSALFANFAFAELDKVAEMRREAEAGVARSQINLALSYLNGDGVPKDNAEAAKWLRKAAEQGAIQAQYNLAFLYDNGTGVPKDSTEAIKWYRKAAEQGDFEAQFNLGLMYVKGGDVPKDSAEAAKWYRKAAEQGDSRAQHNLGVLYMVGDGVPKDNTEAVNWFLRAAEQGDTGSQRNLGVLYLKGEGVPKNTVEGLAWIKVAAASGDAEVNKNRAIIERVLGPEVVIAAEQRSKQIVNAIEQGRHVTSSVRSTEVPASKSLETEIPKASGTGSIVSAEGLVLTAAHVVTGATRIASVTSQGVRSARVLRVDEQNDVAVLKIEGGPYLPVPVASSRSVRLGQSVATIGFPNIRIQGFSPKVTRGEISSLYGAGDDPRSWQISVPVQPGNSGGPLLDENGNLIGVVVSKLGLNAAEATGDMPQNVNYAVRSAYALALLEPFLDGNAPEPKQPNPKRTFADMVANAQASVVLILVY